MHALALGSANHFATYVSPEVDAMTGGMVDEKRFDASETELQRQSKSPTRITTRQKVNNDGILPAYTSCGSDSTDPTPPVRELAVRKMVLKLKLQIA